MSGQVVMRQPCSELRPGHLHCVHGHATDCTDLRHCQPIDAPDDKRPREETYS